MATATVLVLVTWLGAVIVLACLGAPLAALASRGPTGPRVVARALWWGMAVATFLVTAASTAIPLRSPTAAFGMLAAAFAAGLGGALLLRRRGRRWRWRWTSGRVLAAAALGAASLYLALAATGPVTNYDSGLYHLAAIRYAADEAAIPGLANLHAALGYATAQFPLAATLGNGPLGPDGYRALNGLVIAMASIDLVTRMTRRAWSAGTYVLAVGMAVVLVPMVALADYWVTSPTQDAAVFALTVVVAAALTDALTKRRVLPDAGTVVAVGAVLLAIRPTMVVFVAGSLAILALRWWRRRSVLHAGRLASLAGGTFLFVAVALAARDRLLSGWFQYPLSLMAFDVPWQAADPADLRSITLGFARDPERGWESASGFGWIGAWTGRAMRQWEFLALIVLAVLALLALLLARRSGRVRMRTLGIAMVPSGLAAAAWFLASPPAYRFAWGPLFTLAVIPLGWGLWRMREGGGQRPERWAITLLAVPVVAVTIVTAAFRFDWQAPRDERSWGPVAFSLASIEAPVTAQKALESGLVVRVPVEGDQCWSTYPLCTPDPAPGLRLLHSRWSEGLLP